MSASEIVSKVWNYAHVLRDDGVGYGDYIEQITFLIFLKMADEREASGKLTKGVRVVDIRCSSPINFSCPTLNIP